MKNQDYYIWDILYMKKIKMYFYLLVIIKNSNDNEAKIWKLNDKITLKIKIF